jgi:hypothetical protein
MNTAFLFLKHSIIVDNRRSQVKTGNVPVWICIQILFAFFRKQ